MNKITENRRKQRTSNQVFETFKDWKNDIVIAK